MWPTGPHGPLARMAHWPAGYVNVGRNSVVEGISRVSDPSCPFTSDELAPSILGLVVPEKSTCATFMAPVSYTLWEFWGHWFPWFKSYLLSKEDVVRRDFFWGAIAHNTLSKPQRFAEKLMQERYIGKHSPHIECSKARTSRFVNLTLVPRMRVAMSYLQRNCHQLSVRVRIIHISSCPPLPVY